MKDFKIIAFTHKKLDLKEVAKFFIEEDQQKHRLQKLKQDMHLDELMYIATCNRVEFIFVTKKPADRSFLTSFFSSFFFTSFEKQWSVSDIDRAINNAVLYEGSEAMKHLMYVASSLDSLVVGEREIITQVRKSYELCNKNELTGDMIRLVVKKTIEVAKKVYTRTQIAEKPVSVVSLAYRKLKTMKVKQDARFIFVGAGQSNVSMAQYLKKHGFKNFAVFNRSLDKAKFLAEQIKGKAYNLDELGKYKDGFDVLICCTGAPSAIVDPKLYKKLVGKDKDKKILVDLAIPNDIEPSIPEKFNVEVISIISLQQLAQQNLLEREKELERCRVIIEADLEEFKSILNERRVELAMKEVPGQIREIREMALGSVFSKELNQLDAPSRKILEKVIDYVEKKYIKVPMKMAKEILLRYDQQE